MEKRELVNLSMNTIADLITGQRIATGGMYELVWLEDRFACRKNVRKNKSEDVIAYLSCQAINKGLTSQHWYSIRERVRLLIEKGVIK